ncbi:alpha/beta hydrolase [Nocardia asteroides]|uniref:alpha/beta hydrolase n=1 Tax=Nocardia asteroides TaxID=1824 RepID=UPI001E51B451|nr:alpha/beta hydrolase [Nocardia asteroides]UGT55967.1 alpha/beta hydrolase [Nocardia asteroides]
MIDMLDEDEKAFAQALIREAPAPPYCRYGVEGVRSLFDSADPTTPPLRSVHSTEDRTIHSPAGPLRVRCYRPSGDTDLPALIYIHGGGFVVGTLNGVDELCRTLCAEAECMVISVEYRRAPEHVFPAAADDCLWTYEWVQREAGSLGVDPTRVALAGDSAGGNLALSICTSLAETRYPMPRSLVLAYPATSNAHAGPSWEAFEHAPVLCKADATWFWWNYTANTGADQDPRAVPLLSEALHALPPTFVVAAEVDILRSDYEHFAAVALRAGVEIEVRQYEGVLHGFFTEVTTIEKARRAATDAADHLRKHFDL